MLKRHLVHRNGDLFMHVPAIDRWQILGATLRHWKKDAHTDILCISMTLYALLVEIVTGTEDVPRSWNRPAKSLPTQVWKSVQESTQIHYCTVVLDGTIDTYALNALPFSSKTKLCNRA